MAEVPPFYNSKEPYERERRKGMSSFTSPLIVCPLNDGRRWRLFKEFTYHVGSKYSRDSIHVPANSITDFASVPRIFWALLPPWSTYGKAAVLHDYIYQSHCRTREEADRIFYEAMLVNGTGRWKARVMYLAVRWFGWLAWKGKGNEDARAA